MALLGALVTAGTMDRQKSHATYLVQQRETHYLLTVKGDQPALRRQLSQLPSPEVDITDTHGDHWHGRVEKRTRKVVSIDARIVFSHATQAVQITRKVRPLKSKRSRIEKVYAITDLAVLQASPDQLNTWLRGHWSIENRLHWIREVTFSEDQAQTRTGSSHKVMAILRNLAVGLLHLGQVLGRGVARCGHR